MDARRRDRVQFRDLARLLIARLSNDSRRKKDFNLLAALFCFLGFTFVEVAVVIAIIGIFVGVLSPAVALISFIPTRR